MFSRFRSLTRFARDLPTRLPLAYCLVRDPRVPARNKILLLGGIGVLNTPIIDVADRLPLVGEIDVLALSLVGVQLFISTAPEELVAEHEQLLQEGMSRFDADVASGQRAARALLQRLRRRGEQDIDIVGTPVERMKDSVFSPEQGSAS